MIRHIFTLIWNRRRASVLLLLEIFCAFLVLAAVTAFAVFYADNYRQPLGFDRDNVWQITIERPRSEQAASASATGPGQEPPPPQAEDLEVPRLAGEVLRRARSFPEVAAAALAAPVPYDNSTETRGYDYKGRTLRYNVARVSDDAREVLGIDVSEGRWFSREDDGAAWNPVVINRRLAEEVAPRGSAVGLDISSDPEPGETGPRRPLRVVGVVDAFRKGGEFSTPVHYVIERTWLDDPAVTSQPRLVPDSLVVRVQPGTPAAFEETLLAALRDVAREWSFEVRSMDQMRDSSMRMALAPLVATGFVAGFLLLMVALGLTGVLWQAVTQRTREIGLRRALGASGADVRRQVLGELLVLTTFAIVPALVFLAQVPVLDLAPWLTGRVLATALAISVAAVYLLAILCAWYPSRLATRVLPAHALHYE
jgi:putative ABC transport system permease protein